MIDVDYIVFIFIVGKIYIEVYVNIDCGLFLVL